MPPEQNPENGGNKKVVLVVVEDDQYVLEFVKFTLQEEGYEVHGAMDGQEGLELIADTLPVLVVLDLMLPNIDGFSILKKMAERPETAKIPVVVMSAYTASDSTRRMVQTQKNVKDVFTKPLNTEKFVARLKEILS
jgi:DNA-binding response OmpR family regulator